MRLGVAFVCVAVATLACGEDKGLQLGYYPTGTGTGTGTGGGGTAGNGSGGTSSSSGTGGDGTAGNGSGGTPILPTCLEDSFDGASLSAVWTGVEDYESTISVTSGELQIDIITGASQSRTAFVLSEKLDIQECDALIEVVDSNPQDGMVVTFSARKDDWNHVAFVQRADRLELTRTANSNEQIVGDIAYDANAHRWWRFSIDTGSIIWLASADGSTWNQLGSAVDTINLTTPRLRISGSVAPNTSNGSATFDNFNTPPP